MRSPRASDERGLGPSDDPGAMGAEPPSRARGAAAVVLGVALMAMGVLHFVAVDAFVAVMPPYLPWHRELVWLSGVFEIALGAAALVPRARALAGWGVVLLLIAVFPANVQMALEGIGLPGADPPPSWLLWARLPLQAVLIAWALWSTGALDRARRRLRG